VIRFSAILVAGAIAVLVAGVLATNLALVYLSIGVSVLAAVLLAIGVILRRREIFGEAGATAATGQPAWPVTPATETPVMVGGRATIPGPRARPDEADRRPAEVDRRSAEVDRRSAEADRRSAEAGAGSGNGRSGPPPGRDAVAEIRWAPPEEGSPETGPARAPQGRNGPGRNGPGGNGPAKDGPARADRMGGYSGSHSSGRGRPPTAPPGRRPPAAPLVGPGPRGAGEPAAYGDPTDLGPGARPDQGSRSDQGSRPNQGARPDQRAAGTAPPGQSVGPPGRPLAGAGPPEWPGPDITWQEPTGARRPPREPDSGWVFTPPTPPPDLPASPAEEPDAPAPAAKGPDAPAPAATGPDTPAPAAEAPDTPAPAAEALDAGIAREEPAHDRRPSRETEDHTVTPPTPPERPLSPAEPDHQALPNDDRWHRANEEVATGAEREPDGPSRRATPSPLPPPASAGPPPPAAAGDLWSRPADRRSDEVSDAGEAGRGRSAASEQWSAWAPSVFSRPGSPSAGDEDEPRDRPDEGAADTGAEAGTLGPLFAWRDAAADRAGPRDAAADRAGGAGKEEAADAQKEAGDAGKDAGAEAEEPDEEEEAAPSPWSIPLTLVGDLSDLDDEDGGQPADAEDHGTGKPPAAADKPAPMRAGSDVWTRPSWASTEEKRAGSAQSDGGSGPEKTDEADRAGAGAGAGRGPWLIRPGKSTTAGWDSGDAAATRASDKADAPDAKAAADSEAGDGDQAKATPASRDADADGEPAAARPAHHDAAASADRDDADVRASRDSGTDDQAKAADAASGDGDAASRTRADPDADAAAATSAATAGSASTASAGSASAASAGPSPAPGEAGPRTDGEAKPPSATPAGNATPVGRPSATLFEPAGRAMPSRSPDQVTAKTAGPGTQREAPNGAEEVSGQRAPEAGSGTGAGQTGAAPARDDDERGTEKSGTEKSGTEKSGPAPATDGNAVVIVPGVARYHRTGCILIRFLGGDGLETSTAQAAEAKGCAPCRACEPDKPLSSED
jgi:hypothetical protein